MPDDVSKKSLKVLDKKLQLLAEHADFHVNINSVVGGGIHNPEGCAGGRPARGGTGLHLDGRHHSRWRRPAAAAERREREVYHEMRAMEKRSYARFNYFQDNIAHGKPNDWRCRAGARYLYICEDGLVHYCSQQRGYPGKPLLEYTVEDIRREYLTGKDCAPRCTVACVHQIGYIDFWRAPQNSAGIAGRTQSHRSARAIATQVVRAGQRLAAQSEPRPRIAARMGAAFADLNCAKFLAVC